MRRWGGRVLRALGSRLSELAFGFGLVEALFVGALFVLGARYVPAGPPIVLVLFLVVLRASEPGRHRANRVFVHFFWLVTSFLAVTGMAASWSATDSTPQLLARVMHQAMAVPGTLLWAVWTYRHVRRAAPANAVAVVTSGRIAWLALKVSLWSGAVVALLVILEGLIPVHVVSLGIAAVLVAAHVVVARRWRAREVREALPEDYVALAGPSLGRVLGTSGIAGAALAALFVWGPRGYDGTNLSVGVEQATVAAHAEFGDGFVRTESGAAYSPTVLGQSTTCGNPSCHPFVFSEWKVSPHRRTASAAYRDAVEAEAASRGRAAAASCMSCHDPLSVLAGAVGEDGELTTPEGRREGLSCLFCHSTSVRREGATRQLAFRFPTIFGSVALDARSMLSLTPRHRAELAIAKAGSDDLCIACHRIPSLATGDERAHQQARMRPECRGDEGCVGCHMPRSSRNARPGQPLAPSHAFVARLEAPTP
ncbi:MAG: multiheme c-type cytochrome [bacterium]